MSDPIRYDFTYCEDCNWMHETEEPNGKYVLHKDYALLQQENEKLKSRLASIDAILKVCFSPIPKITQHTKNRNG